MKTVLVTGLIGSGKSAVTRLLSGRGIPVYNSDERTKQLYKRSPSLVSRLEQALGTPLRGEDGSLDKARLSALIFSNPEARVTLEGIVYPVLLQSFKRWRRRQKGAPFVVMESAIALSKPLFRNLPDAVVLVTAPRELRLQRVMSRSGLSREEVLARMSAQTVPEEEASVILDNSGSLEELSRQVDAVFFQENSYLCKLLKK